MRTALEGDIQAAWGICADLFIDATPKRNRPDQAELYEELAFCLLGGHGIPYELARSAATKLLTLNPFDENRSDVVLEREIRRELETPQFEPRRNDGSLRKYRFPASKATLLVRARQWLTRNDNLLEQLIATRGEPRRREHLCECPGIGPKTASWILRNTGLARDLAILDVHVMRALRETGRITVESLPRDYEAAEIAFLTWCEELEAPAAAFDLFLWEWMRGTLQDPR